MSVWNDFAGGLDHLAGSTDEAVSRQFDDTQGGGVFHGINSTVAGIGDFLGGDVDESVGRSFNWIKWLTIAVVGLLVASKIGVI